MQGQTKTRETRIIHTPCKNMEAVFEQEYEKGEVSGIFLVCNMPQKLLEDFENELKTREEKLPLEED